MADQWEFDTFTVINNRRTELGLPLLVWDEILVFEAVNYWSRPLQSPNIAKAIDCPHWTSPQKICDLLWCDELCNYYAKFAAIVIRNDNVCSHIALALKGG
jgi:hypothetical protein